MKHDILPIGITQKSSSSVDELFLLKLTRVEPLSSVSLLDIYMLSQDLSVRKASAILTRSGTMNGKTHMPSAEA